MTLASAQQAAQGRTSHRAHGGHRLTEASIATLCASARWRRLRAAAAETVGAQPLGVGEHQLLARYGCEKRGVEPLRPDGQPLGVVIRTPVAALALEDQQVRARKCIRVADGWTVRSAMPRESRADAESGKPRLATIHARLCVARHAVAGHDWHATLGISAWPYL